MSTRLRALILEDSPADAELVIYELRRAGFDPDYQRVDTEEDYLARLKPDLDVILSDYSMPQFNAPQALSLLQESRLDIPFIVITGTVSEEAAVDCMKRGAADYLLKDRLSRLGQAVGQVLQRKRAREEKWLAEAALRESEQRFHNAFENAPIGMTLTAPDGRFLQVNRAMCELLGYPNEELVGTHFQSITHPDDAPASEQHLLSLLGDGIKSFGLEKRYIHKFGHGIWAHTSVSLVRDARGGPLYFIAQIKDITERKRAEEELTYRVRFEELISTISTSFITLPPDEIDDGINRALREIGEFTTVDRSYIFLFTDEEKRKMSNTHEWCAAGIEPQKETLQELSVEDFPWWMERLNRFENIHVPRVADLPPEAKAEKKILEAQGIQSVVVVPMIYGKSLIGFFGFDYVCAERTWSEESIALLKIVGEIFVNALERKRSEEALHRSEEQLRQAQKMESIGTLAGGIAHDFNNLLTVILGNTQLALRLVRGDDTLNARLVEIERAGNRASSLTRQLLAFSRRQRLERRTLNLNDAISDVARMLRRVIGEDIHVNLKLAPDLCPVFADPGQIEQVIVNLAINARDAMPHGGRLTIETLNVDMDESYLKKYAYVQPGRYVQIRVSDNGTGMTEEIKARIFEPFFTTKEIGKGTGLGLSMVYGIIKQHEGYINVYSEPGHGTAFKLYLPVAAAAEEEEVTATLFPLLGGTETILVAEDEEPLRALARDVLEALGYRVVLAKTGEEAVEIFKTEGGSIDLILLDVVMPRMGGHEAYERIRELNKEVPVIFMTGYSAETVQSKFVKQNKFMEGLGSALIQKPYNVEILGRKVREILDEHTGKR